MATLSHFILNESFFLFCSEGLRNTENNCFLNTIIQVLRQVPFIKECAKQDQCRGKIK